ncbi:Penicillin-binding protein 1F [Paraliobacillus sp. PM-2]|uniref:transglycosylase domain-containing protein n=1 Tax=Paraliobacillus sp. PM-2 TaxID=1462524 RepID=UPI00061CBE28|nr:PBP1A family penicillin-binding protein [Paraliobacillus sp. PM-2]CQR47027.1 Penicillin-binding protein 1F [Paraliobacillus sp. PM-2]
MNLIKKLFEYVRYPWVKWISIVLGAIFLLGIIGFVFIIFGGELVVNEEDLILPATTIVETEDGELVGKLYKENRELVSIDQIPNHVQQAFVAVEDVRFDEHAGVDFKSVVRAVYRDILAMEKVEGASTITQQLAKNLFLDNDKTWMRKTKEVMASLYLERHFSKDKLLEMYMNEVYFAHGIYGVGTAASYYFDKSVEELTVTEGALLAGLVKAPNNYSPYIDKERSKARRDIVLSQMEKAGMLETEEMLSLQGKTINIVKQNDEDKPWLDDYLDVVIKEAASTYQLTTEELKRGGYHITVYMNDSAQRIAYQALQKDNYFHGSEPNVEASFVLLDQASGQFEAVIGGRDFNIGDHNRAFIPRQPGSVMKPLAVYGPALMNDYGVYSLLKDRAQSYDDYQVTNADGTYAGDITMYEAVEQSKNAAAVWLLDQIGIDYSKTYLEKMHLSLPDKGLAIALGGLKNGLTPIQIAEAYRTFGHNGEWIEAHAIATIRDRNGKVIGKATPATADVFTKQAAWNMLRMLENVVENGTASSGDYQKALAGKTGTTEHPQIEGKAKDAWFAGITPEYTTALWMGYDQSDAAHYLTKGSSAATIVTKEILQAIDQQQSLTSSFVKPTGVDDVEEPISLPIIDDLSVSYKLGGWSLVQGQLTWTASDDDRVIYHIYKITENGSKQIGQVQGKGQYTLKDVSLFESSSYYVVPYNQLSKQQGEESNQITLSLKD